MLKKTKLAVLVAAVCAYQNIAMAEETNQLEEISVVEIETSDTLVNTKVFSYVKQKMLKIYFPIN